MNGISPDQVRELLRNVPYPGFARDIVSVGFVRDIDTDGRKVVVHFSPNSTDADKIRLMEQGIRGALAAAAISDVRIATSRPFDEDDMALRKPIATESDSDYEIDQAMTGEGVMNPLQAELQLDGIAAEPDLLRADASNQSRASGIGFGGNEPQPFEGPTAPGETYDGALPVYQWEIDPHDPSAASAETSVKIDDWEIRVWWQVHPSGDLIYASLQAMREDWADHIGGARQHPVGRSAAVNLVFDNSRQAVLAIYGTVRDFRPFVEAFRRAYASPPAEEAAESQENAK